MLTIVYFRGWYTITLNSISRTKLKNRAYRRLWIGVKMLLVVVKDDSSKIVGGDRFYVGNQPKINEEELYEKTCYKMVIIDIFLQVSL